MNQPLGSFVLILHSHIPYVLGHGTWPHGSVTLYEAAADTYIPLLWMLEELGAEGIQARITISFSAVTAEQLADERFKEWFVWYLEDKERAAADNARDFARRGEGHLQHLAELWRDRYAALREAFCGRYQRDLPAAFRYQQEVGNIELMTCAATHGYLPLLHEDSSVNAQTAQAVASYRRLFGAWPRGMWLPECAYRPAAMWAPPPQIIGPQAPYQRRGLEQVMACNGLDYFVVDTHMLGGGGPEPVYASHENTLGKLWGHIRKLREPRPYSGDKSPYLPYFVGHYYEDHPGIACLVRDPQTGLKVWSAQVGYPGDFWYRDFHKKHIPGDHRYWRVTDDSGDLGSKQVYEPQRAEERAREHAGNFLWTIKETLRAAPHPDGRLPVLCAPFDAELIGHWWFEGPRFLVHALRWMHHDPDIAVVTARQYLERNEPQAAITLPEGSWGAGGGHWVWLNPDTEWTWRRIYDAELDLRALLRDHGTGHDEPMRALLKQACRELLLLQASDWQFLITTGEAPDYAASRIHCHHSDYKRIADMARRYGRGEWIAQHEWDEFGNICARDAIFEDIEPEWFLGR